MVSVRIYIPYHEGDDVEPDGFVHVDMAGVPRVGDTMIHSAIAHPVKGVTWHMDGGHVTVYLGDPTGAVTG